MMEWSYLYLAIPPAVAVVGAVVGGRLVRQSTERVDRMQRQFDAITGARRMQSAVGMSAGLNRITGEPT